MIEPTVPQSGMGSRHPPGQDEFAKQISCIRARLQSCRQRV